MLCIKKAKELIESGKNFAEVTALMDEYVKNIYLLFTLSTYENLVKAGRLSKFSGYIATHLGIRTLAAASPEGTIDILQKIRGEKKVYKAIVTKMQEQVNLAERRVYIHHCHNLDGATKIKELLLEAVPACEVNILPTRGLTSYYAEEGGLIISF
ncbi:DegV family protein [Cellulosilyticum ruminicola]|uniref:DegV family protein n=1 Tax=Cellulosilyticum ruminicola TaxID=425254 RepID=UPI00242029F1|nr:DegV family protein [Cellulosilyticum ruminicola]